MREFGAFLQSRVKLGFADAPSPAVVEQIVGLIKKNPEKALTSESHRVHLATKRIWNFDSDE